MLGDQAGKKENIMKKTRRKQKMKFALCVILFLGAISYLYAPDAGDADLIKGAAQFIKSSVGQAVMDGESGWNTVDGLARYHEKAVQDLASDLEGKKPLLCEVLKNIVCSGTDASNTSFDPFLGLSGQAMSKLTKATEQGFDSAQFENLARVNTAMSILLSPDAPLDALTTVFERTMSDSPIYGLETLLESYLVGQGLQITDNMVRAYLDATKAPFLRGTEGLGEMSIIETTASRIDELLNRRLTSHIRGKRVSLTDGVAIQINEALKAEGSVPLAPQDLGKIFVQALETYAKKASLPEVEVLKFAESFLGAGAGSPFFTILTNLDSQFKDQIPNLEILQEEVRLQVIERIAKSDLVTIGQWLTILRHYNELKPGREAFSNEILTTTKNTITKIVLAKAGSPFVIAYNKVFAEMSETARLEKLRKGIRNLGLELRDLAKVDLQLSTVQLVAYQAFYNAARLDWPSFNLGEAFGTRVTNEEMKTLEAMQRRGNFKELARWVKRIDSGKFFKGKLRADFAKIKF